MNIKKILITLGALLIITGCLSDVYHFYQIFKKDPHEVSFKVPGSIEVDVTKAGNYTLWHDYKTLYEGVVYNTSQELEAGTRISIIDSFGQRVHLDPNAGSHSSHGSHSKVSIGEIEISSPATLHIEVEGSMEPSVFSFSESRLLKNFLALMFSTFVLIFPGGGLLFWGIMLKSKTPPPLPTT